LELFIYLLNTIYIFYLFQAEWYPIHSLGGDDGVFEEVAVAGGRYREFQAPWVSIGFQEAEAAIHLSTQTRCDLGGCCTELERTKDNYQRR